MCNSILLAAQLCHKPEEGKLIEVASCRVSENVTGCKDVKFWCIIALRMPLSLSIIIKTRMLGEIRMMQYKRCEQRNLHENSSCARFRFRFYSSAQQVRSCGPGSVRSLLCCTVRRRRRWGGSTRFLQIPAINNVPYAARGYEMDI